MLILKVVLLIKKTQSVLTGCLTSNCWTFLFLKSVNNQTFLQTQTSESQKTSTFDLLLLELNDCLCAAELKCKYFNMYEQKNTQVL